MHFNLATRRSGGFTLIELILALGLSAVLLALLASALTLGVSRAVGSREKVEEARLIEGVISLIRNDVHRAVIYDPQDTSTAMELAEASAGFDVDSIDEIGSGAGGGASGGGGGGIDNSSSSDSGSSTTALSLRQPLGVYGTLQELQIDVLREHPQYEVDETGSVIAPTGTSGITTVRYALGQGMASLGVSQSLEGAELGTGLVRQEVSRDLLNWASQTGSAASLAGTPQLVAPEVTQLEIRYFDGTQLLETWDSQLMEGALPRAIELRLWFVQEQSAGEDENEVVSRTETTPYVVTIALPSTWNAADTDVVSATSNTGTDSSSTGSSSLTGGDR